jgi:hypothetical protein
MTEAPACYHLLQPCSGVHENGDVHCPNDFEWVSQRCWKCGWVRPDRARWVRREEGRTMSETRGTTAEEPWWQKHSAMVLLTRFMADSGDYSADQVAYAVEKPWKHDDLYKQAVSSVKAVDG